MFFLQSKRTLVDISAMNTHFHGSYQHDFILLLFCA